MTGIGSCRISHQLEGSRAGRIAIVLSRVHAKLLGLAYSDPLLKFRRGALQGKALHVRPLYHTFWGNTASTIVN